jgi:hypothetical protein
MAKGGRRYARDARGRFASTGSGGGKSRPAAKPAPRGKNKLTRDNAGKITGTGNGATARGGRLKTAGGNLRATQTAKIKGGGRRLRGGKSAPAAGLKPVASKPREPKTNAQILAQTRRIIEKASARKEKARFGHDMAKNKRRIEKATAIRQAIMNPPKPKPKKRDPNRMTPSKAANRRWGASMDAWNRAQRGY